MGWPTKGSGRSYNSHTGFGCMMGAYTKKVVYSCILSRLCRICDTAKSLGVTPRMHNCIKNCDCTSKRMESIAILRMVSSCPKFRKFVSDWIISDDDSSMRAILQHFDPDDPKDKGLLPDHILEPQFKADPSHRIKVVAKYFYLLKNQAAAKSKMNAVTARRLKRSWGYMIRQNIDSPLDEFVTAAKAVLEHTFNNHEFCGDWCQGKRAIKEGKVYDNPRGYLSKETEDGLKLYRQIGGITTKYGSEHYLDQSRHPFHTQSNEAIHQSQSTLTPKNKVFHSSRSFHYRNAITICTHNDGFNHFWFKVFSELCIPVSRLFVRFADKVSDKRERWKRWHSTTDVKRRRAYKQAAIEKEQLYEKHAKDYGSGIGLEIGSIRTKRPKKRQRTKRTKCKCGATTHLTTRSKACPLNKANVAAKKIAEINSKEAKREAIDETNEATEKNSACKL